jgi:hypothetical protein
MENLTTKQNLEGVLNHAQTNINNSFSTIYSKEDVLNMLKFIQNNTEQNNNVGIKEWLNNVGMEMIKGIVKDVVTSAVDGVNYEDHVTMDGYDNGGEYRVSVEVDQSDIEEAIMNNLDLDNFEEKLLEEISIESHYINETEEQQS